MTLFAIVLVVVMGWAWLVEETVIDVVDEPLPGVVRLTEIEETEVMLPDTEEEE